MSGLRNSTVNSWRAMLRRCTDTNADQYARYGGRGITVCERWRSFDNFVADMGLRPEGMTLDRRNPDGHYEPSNCRWATAKEQSQNRTNNRVIDADGKSLCLSEWARITGLTVSTIWRRLHLGWNDTEAVMTPKGQRNRWSGRARA